MSEAAEITKKSKSNLAFAFLCLPRNRRQDMVCFYAFCRVIDDLADDPALPLPEKISGLNDWKQCFLSNAVSNQLQRDILEIRDRYAIDSQLFLDLIAGCESDLSPHRRFANWAELEKYTYRVASCVGLISIKIFGCQHPDSSRYAIALGHALQLTNILRDVGEDLRDNIRIYIPLQDMIRFQYTERDLIGRVHDGRFIAMMGYIAERAEHFYLEAQNAFPISDRKALRASEGMRNIYHDILQKMRADHFQVFEKRYSLSKLKKIWHLIASFIH